MSTKVFPSPLSLPPINHDICLLLMHISKSKILIKIFHYSIVCNTEMNFFQISKLTLMLSALQTQTATPQSHVLESAAHSTDPFLFCQG